MSRRTNRTNAVWETPESGFNWEHVQVELLMDIRTELQRLNRLLHCQNFIGIPATLRSMRKAMPAKRKTVRAKATP